MSKTFDVRELLRLAVIDERSGARLYEKLAGGARDAALKGLFADLVQQEHRHERRFQEMLDNLETPQAFGQYPDPYVDYLEALVAEGRSREQTDAGEQAAAASSDRQALDLALRFEKEQLRLLADVGQVINPAHKPLVDEVIAEERAHLVQLTAARNRPAES